VVSYTQLLFFFLHLEEKLRPETHTLVQIWASHQASQHATVPHNVTCYSSAQPVANLQASRVMAFSSYIVVRQAGFLCLSVIAASSATWAGLLQMGWGLPGLLSLLPAGVCEAAFVPSLLTAKERKLRPEHDLLVVVRPWWDSLRVCRCGGKTAFTAALLHPTTHKFPHQTHSCIINSHILLIVLAMLQCL